jgi:hypothetical protein
VLHMGKLRVVQGSSAASRAHGRKLQNHGAGPDADPQGATQKPYWSDTEESLGRLELAESGTELRRLLDAVRVSAPTNVIARLEGAIIVLDALAAGKPPSADDLLVPGPYTI